MDTLHPRCAGLDVHKDTVVACVRWLDQRQRPQQEIQTFGTTTPDLLDLLDWLQKHHVPIVALEATGVYWKPIFNLLESHMDVILVNPEHIKKVPGRKTASRIARGWPNCSSTACSAPASSPTAPSATCAT
jgi:transposase